MKLKYLKYIEHRWASMAHTAIVVTQKVSRTRRAKATAENEGREKERQKKKT